VGGQECAEGRERADLIGGFLGNLRCAACRGGDGQRVEGGDAEIFLVEVLGIGVRVADKFFEVTRSVGIGTVELTLADILNGKISAVAAFGFVDKLEGEKLVGFDHGIEGHALPVDLNRPATAFADLRHGIGKGFVLVDEADVVVPAGGEVSVKQEIGGG